MKGSKRSSSGSQVLTVPPPVPRIEPSNPDEHEAQAWFGDVFARYGKGLESRSSLIEWGRISSKTRCNALILGGSK